MHLHFLIMLYNNHLVQIIEMTNLSNDTVATIAATHRGGEASGTPG